MLYCFLDTNIFLEFKPITEINWLKELDASKVCLIVTSVVVQELDNHKSGNNSRLKKKARKWTAFLEKLDVGSDNAIRQNVTLRLDLSEPNVDTFADYNLSASVADDRLLAKIIEFAKRNEAHNVVVVSDDSAVHLKARGQNLSDSKLSEENRLEHESDPIKKELNELRIENARLRNTQPKLQLGFRDATSKLRNFVRTWNDFSKSHISESELDDFLQNERDRLQFVRKEQPIDNDHFSVISTFAVFQKIVTNGQIDEYYRNVDEYLERYRGYLIDKSLASVFPHRSIELNFALTNAGSIPAQNVEIRLDMVGCTEVLIHLPEVPTYKPTPPAKPEPRSPLDINQFLPSSFTALNYGILDYDTDLGPSLEEWTQESNSSGQNWYEYRIKKLKHHRSRDLEPLYLWFQECDEFPVKVGIQYEVTSDNMVDMLTGSLTVLVAQSAP